MEWKSLELSSEVVIEYGPFPGGLYWEIQARALEEHPDPEPPRKKIETVDGFEEIDDLEDPDYNLKLNAARLARFNLLGEAVLEFCVRIVSPDNWEETVQRLATKYVKSQPPTEPTEKRVWYLANFALRTPQDWKIVRLVQRFSQVEDEEVARRVEFFRGNVAGSEGS